MVVVEWVTTGGPDGEARRWFQLDGDAIVVPPGDAARSGESGQAADLVLTSDDATTAAIAASDVSPSVAYMRGDLKAAGNTGLLFDLLAHFDDPDKTAALGAVLQP